jgi:AAA15 family ATPase/GTPase
MELVSFSVSNYRSVTSAYRLPIRRPTVLIGPNNEGKSNILRALVSSLQFLGSLGGVAFPQISRQIMMSKLIRSHANATNEICRRVQVRGGQASHR